MTTTSASIAAAKPVPLWRRFAAMLYDLFPLLGLWIVGAGLWMLAFHRGDDLRRLVVALQAPVEVVLRDLWLLSITAAYFVVSWMRVGATIGMRAWKLRLVDGDGARVGWRTGLPRFLLALLSLALFGCGFWYAWFDAEGRTLHDRICGTRMTRL